MKITAQKITGVAFALMLAVGVAVPAMASAQTTVQTSAACNNAVFVRDLTIGSTGSDVIALQTFLIAKGHLTIPYGVSKGYFGPLTRAATAQYQAANGIAPVAGYFGPITRAAVNIDCATDNDDDNNNDNDNNNGTLDGDGDVRDFDIKAEDDAESASDDEHVATIEFEVEDGDVLLDRLDLYFESPDSNNSDVWDNIESITLMVDGDEIASTDVSDDEDWDEHDVSGNFELYSFNLDVDTVFEENEQVEIEVILETSDEVETGDADEDYRLWAELRFRNGEDVIFYEGGDDNDDSDAIAFAVTSLDQFGIDFSESNDSPDNSMTLDLSEDTEETMVIVDAEVEDNQDGTLEDATVELVVTLAGTSTVDVSTDELIDEVQFFIDGDEIDADDASMTIDAGDLTATIVYSFDLDDMEVEAEDLLEIEVVTVFNELDEDSDFVGATVKVTEITIDGENQEGDDFATQTENTSYAATFTATAGAIDIDFTENPVAFEGATDNTGTIVFTVRVENNTGSTLTGMDDTSNWDFDVEGYGGISVDSVTDEDGNAADASLADGEDAEYEITLNFTSVSSQDFRVEIEEIADQNVPVAEVWEE